MRKGNAIGGQPFFRIMKGVVSTCVNQDAGKCWSKCCSNRLSLLLVASYMHITCKICIKTTAPSFFKPSSQPWISERQAVTCLSRGIQPLHAGVPPKNSFHKRPRWQHRQWHPKQPDLSCLWVPGHTS